MDSNDKAIPANVAIYKATITVPLPPSGSLLNPPTPPPVSEIQADLAAGLAADTSLPSGVTVEVRLEQ